MLKKALLQFNSMHKRAFMLLLLCLNIILFSLCALNIYIDSASQKELFALARSQEYITKTYLSSLLISFGGSFLLDYAHLERKHK